MSPTPKQERKYKRSARPADTTHNVRSWRITASWNDRPNHPIQRRTRDRHERKRLARQFAEQGAYVIVEQHVSYGVWRTIAEIDGPAQLRAQAAAEAKAAGEAQRRAQEAEVRLNAAGRAAGRRDRLARLMAQPPIPRDQAGTRTARHITGTQRPR
ncbi:hypothetical protein ACFQ61_02015 [Streptomyces sp. NPDC056500]|uniref:hypothetical protein n=1 Tax=Streptomyces sp. NPDC056500 TaxID=3345840 RepID=UPI0036C2902C